MAHGEKHGKKYRITVILQASGPDPRISDLANLTHAKLYGKTREFDSQEAKIYFTELELTSEAMDEEAAIVLSQRWLERHSTLLHELHARLQLEIQTVIELEMGSKGLLLPCEFLGVLADLDCDLLHQYCRELGNAGVNASPRRYA